MPESLLKAETLYPSIFSLEGKIALITGGGSGIGFYTAQCMVQAGAHVVLTGRRETVYRKLLKS